MATVQCECGGGCVVYRTTRTRRFKRQYRKCQQCGGTSKTMARIPPPPRRLTPNEIEAIVQHVPTLANLVLQSGSSDLFLVSEMQQPAKMDASPDRKQEHVA